MIVMRRLDLEPTKTELEEIFRIKYGNPKTMGWGPRMRHRFNYFTPDDYYEAIVVKLVTAGCAWLDVGSGRHIFPSNGQLARILAERCTLLVGVDPDETLDENTFVHQRVKSPIEDYRSDQMFDVVTLRMVAEHITNPKRTLEALSRLTKPGGMVVIYTINCWSPVPIFTWLTPFSLHHSAKRFLWRTDKRDTFPVRYRMNTRKALGRLLEDSGFQECHFAYLDDCRTFSRFRTTLFLELISWGLFQAFGLRYPENCLLGIYTRL